LGDGGGGRMVSGVLEVGGHIFDDGGAAFGAEVRSWG
jgi:hypothetical protein